MRPNAKLAPEQREQTVCFCVVLWPAKPPRAWGLHEMKPSRAVGKKKKKKKKGRARKPAALQTSLWTGEWAKPSRLRRQKEDLQLHTAAVNNQAQTMCPTYIH